MADKKITELGSLTTITSDDLFVVVDNPSGTPVTRKTTAGNVFSFIQNTLVSNAISLATSGLSAGNTVWKVTLSGGGNTNATISTLTAAEITVDANASSQNTATQFGLSVASKLSGVTANVKSEHAVGKFVLDISNAAVAIANTSVLRLEVANTGTRVANLQSFISFGDKAANSTSAQTLYLFDIGQNGNVSANVASGAACSAVLFSNSAASVSHKLKIRVNGTDYWILLTDSAS